jgi:hypothetical protein
LAWILENSRPQGFHIGYLGNFHGIYFKSSGILLINQWIFYCKSFKVGFNVGLEQLYEILNSLDKYGMSLEND